MSGETKQAHTPEPWEAEVRGKRWDVYPTPRYPCQQPVASGHARDLGETFAGESEANARLIAAAPELLEALRAVTHQAAKEIDQSATHDGLNNCKLLTQARAAIAKAEGGAS